MQKLDGKTVLYSKNDIIEALGADATGPDWVATGFSKDSRTLVPGDLFIALRGPKVDGHLSVADAFKAGAVAAIVDHIPQGLQQDAPLVIVPETLGALSQIASLARSRMKGQVIGVTGSFGKTGCKDALLFLLQNFGETHGSERSFNNHWGVPYTLAKMPQTCAYAVIEMGMNHAGELKTLAKIARPNVALITTVAEMHIENLGSIEGVADAKAEIFQGLEPGSAAVLNADDSMFTRLEAAAHAKSLKIITFGRSPRADFKLLHAAIDDGQLHVEASFLGQSFTYTMRGVGEHWALNSLSVLATLAALDLNPVKASQRLKDFILPEGRGVQHLVSLAQGDITVIDESYNAGPESMRAALKVLGGIAPKGNGRRIAILGDMRELGPMSKDIHEGLSVDLGQQNVDLVYACGPLIEDLYRILPKEMQGGCALDVADLVSLVQANVRPGDVYMIKGSKGQYAHRGRMYGFVEALLALANTPLQHAREA